MVNKEEDIIDKSEDLFDDDEYKKALETLNSSKSSRVASMKKEKKEKEKEKESKKDDKNTNEESFVEKCKKDPVIPICIAALAVIAFFAFFFLTKFIIGCFKNDDLGITTTELRTNYQSTELYSQVLVNGNFAIPEIIVSDAIAAEGETIEDDIKYFMTVIPNTTGGYATFINGSCDEDDQTIKELKIAISYNDAVSPELDRFAFIDLFFASYLEVFISDYTETQIEIMIGDAILDAKLDSYYYAGDIAFKVTSNVNSDQTGHLVVLDIIPKSQIDETLLVEVKPADSSVTFADYLERIATGNR